VKQSEYFSLAGLIERGWTRTPIERFLPKPDAAKPNPIFRRAAPLRLYRRERVEVIEATEEFQTALKRAEVRRRAAMRAVETKTALTLKMAEQLLVKVEQMSLGTLLKRAMAHYEALHDHLRSVKCKPWGEADPFRDRICVNYLRHNATQYHEHLDRINGKVGRGQAYLLLWQRIGKEIETKYPALAAEFKRQYRERARQSD
jgi:hypothetical protein